MNQEQLDELEALKAIYGEGIDIIDSHTFDILVEPFPGEVCDTQVRLKMAYSQNYPEELPFYAFKPIKGISESEVEALCAHARSIMEKDLGSPMVFDIIEGVKEWLQNRLQVQEEEAKIEVPVVPKHATYTPVTVESFQAWKTAFLAEQQEREMREKEAIQNDVCMNGISYAEVWSKPTGRQMFEKQNWAKMEAVEEPGDEDAKEEELEDYEEPLELPEQDPID